MFENTDVQTLDIGSLSKFYKRQQIYIMYFYNPKLPECKRFEEEYTKIASKLYGIIQVGAIDCLREEELCEEFGVFDIPQIMIFSEQLSDDGERYKGKMEFAAIAGKASAKMQSFVSSINNDNYDSWYNREEKKNKVVLFTDSKKTPTLYKALSKRYNDRLSFGEVRKSEEELCKKFGITEFPTLVALKNPSTMEVVKYEGEMNVDQMGKFLSAQAAETPKKIVKTEF